jgi:hypothetical protein
VENIVKVTKSQSGRDRSDHVMREGSGKMADSTACRVDICSGRTEISAEYFTNEKSLMNTCTTIGFTGFLDFIHHPVF